MRYRSDIDGLRAAAVLPVVLFHAGLRFFPGGFVGVDVFFVISGFLICGLIDPEIRTGRFSFLTFYKRRILRIFPALFAMLSATAILAALFMLPTELTDFSDTLLAAALSVSNIVFAGQSGYFDGPALTKPLLHTWSLGVEEQFYLVVPVLLVAAARFPRAVTRWGLAGLGAASFAAACLVARSHPVTAFYWMPFRFFELALGALAALGLFPVPAGRWSREGAGLVGLAFVSVPVFVFSSATPFWLATLVPSTGALLVILAGSPAEGARPALASRLLAWRPAVFIGLISYSLYLWHWPIIVFQNQNALVFHNSASYASKVGLVGLSLLVATASFWLIERPFRHAAPRWPAPRVLQGAVAVMLLAVGLSATARATNGADFRFPAKAVAVAAYLGYQPGGPYREGRCFVTELDAFERGTCLHRAADRPNVLLMGDSHAAHLWPGLSAVFTDANVMQATASGCKPVIVHGLLDAPGCSALMHFVFDDDLQVHPVDAVLLAAQWKDSDLPKLAVTLDWLRARGLKAIVAGPIIQYDYSLPRLLADAIRTGDAALPDAHEAAGLRDLDTAIRRLSEAKGAGFVSLIDALCEGAHCLTEAAPGVPLQFDYAHLTEKGSVLLAQHLRARGLDFAPRAQASAINWPLRHARAEGL